VHRLGVYAWQISGVGVAVGVAVRHIEKQDEIMSACYVCVLSVTHGFSPFAPQCA